MATVPKDLVEEAPGVPLKLTAVHAVVEIESKPSMLETLRKWYGLLSVGAAAAVVNIAAWRFDEEDRVLLFALNVAWLLLFLPSDLRKRIVAIGATIFSIGLIVTKQEGLFVALAWLGVQAAYMPDDLERSALRIPTILSGLAAYLLAAHYGLFWFLDDQLGRRAFALTTLLKMHIQQSSLEAVIGSWGLVWTILIFCVSKATTTKMQPFARAGAIFAVWLVPIVMSLAFVTSLPLVILSAVVAFRLSHGTARTARRSFGLPIKIVLAAGLALSLGAVFATSGTQAPRRVAIAPIGLGTVVPKNGAPTSTTTPYEANFDRFYRFLRDQGIEPVTLPHQWGARDLVGVDTAIFINQQVVPSDDQVKALYSAVGDGLRLAIVCDHTDIEGIRGPSNKLLGPVPMSMDFDSAMPLPDFHEWHKAMWINPRLSGAAPTSQATGISVGASVRVSGLAEPIVIGVMGFDDRADPTNPPGHLGNMQFDIGEPIYGVPLVAQASYGKGSVIAFGDTSSFQNSALMDSGRFVISSISKTGASIPAKLASDVLLVLATLGVIVVAFANLKWAPVSIAVITLGLLAGTALTQSYANPGLNYRNAFVYDESLRPQYPGVFPEETTERLSDMADRARVEILDGDMGDALRAKSPCLILNASTVKPSSRQVDEIHRYVSEGGNLIVTAGSQNRDVMRDLLASFNLAIGTEPLGGTDTSEIVDPEFKKQIVASIIASHEPIPTSFLKDAYEVKGVGRVLTTSLDRPTSLIADYGRGKVILIGDSRFCTSKNLGEQLNVTVPACTLLYEILEFCKSRPAANLG